MANSSSTRSFVSGRQSEQLYNAELWKNFESTKHLLDIPKGAAKSPSGSAIDGALWLDRSTNELKSFNRPSGSWDTVFRDKFRLVDQIMDRVQPENPVLGQLWLQNNILFFFDGANWAPVRTSQQTGGIPLGMFDNFYLASPLERTRNYVVPEDELDKFEKHVKDSAQVVVDNWENRFSPSLIQDMPNIDKLRIEGQSQYLVPNINLDRIYLNGKLDHGYTSPNEISVNFPNSYLKSKDPALVHVNPNHLSKITKRLFKIDKERSKIEISSTNTEFYAFHKNNPYGDFLQPSLDESKGDYEVLTGAIYLNKHTIDSYDYVLAITYEFNWYRGSGSLSTFNSEDRTTSYFVDGYQAETAFFVEGIAMDDTSYKINGPAKLVTFDDDTTNLEIGAMHTYHQEHGIIEKTDSAGNGIIKLSRSFSTPLLCVDGIAMHQASPNSFRPYAADYTFDRKTGTIKVIGGLIGAYWTVIELYDWKHDYNMFLDTGIVQDVDDHDKVPVIEYSATGHEGETMALFVDGVLVKKEDLEYRSTDRKTVRVNRGLTEGEPYGVIKKNTLAKKKGYVQDYDIHDKPIVRINDKQAGVKDFKFVQDNKVLTDAKVVALEERCMTIPGVKEGQHYNVIFDRGIAKSSGQVKDVDIYGEPVINHPCLHGKDKMAVFVDGLMVHRENMDVGKVADATIFADGMKKGDTYQIFVGRASRINKGTIENRDASYNAIIPVDKKIADDVLKNLIVIAGDQYFSSEEIIQTIVDERCIVCNNMQVGQRYALLNNPNVLNAPVTNDVAYHADAGKVSIPLRYGITNKYLTFVNGVLVPPESLEVIDVIDTAISAPAMMQGGNYSMLTQSQTESNKYAANKDHAILLAKSVYDKLSAAGGLDKFYCYPMDGENPIDTKGFKLSSGNFNEAVFSKKWNIAGREGQFATYYHAPSTELQVYKNNIATAEHTGELVFRIERASEWNLKEKLESEMQEFWLIDGELVPLTEPKYLEDLIANAESIQNRLIAKLDDCTSCIAVRGKFQFIDDVFYENGNSGDGTTTVARAFRIKASGNNYVISPCSDKAKGMALIKNSLIFADGALVDPDTIAFNDSAGTVYFHGLYRDTKIQIVHFEDGAWSDTPITNGHVRVPDDKEPVLYFIGGELVKDGYTIGEVKGTQYQVYHKDFKPKHEYLIAEKALFDKQTKPVKNSENNGAGRVVENAAIFGDFKKCFLLYRGKHVLPSSFVITKYPYPRKFLHTKDMLAGERYSICEIPKATKTLSGNVGNDSKIDISSSGWSRDEKLKCICWIDGTIIPSPDVTFSPDMNSIIVKNAKKGQYFFVMTEPYFQSNYGTIKDDKVVGRPCVHYDNYIDENEIATSMLFVDGLLVEKEFQVLQHHNTYCIAPKNPRQFKRHTDYMIFDKRNFRHMQDKVTFYNNETKRYEVQHVVPHEDDMELIFVLNNAHRKYTAQITREHVQIAIDGLKKGQKYSIVEGETLDVVTGATEPLGSTSTGVIRYGVRNLAKVDFESGFLFVDGLLIDHKDIIYSDENGKKYLTVNGMRVDRQFSLLRNLASKEIEVGDIKVDDKLNIPLIRFKKHDYRQEDLAKYMCTFVDGKLAETIEKIRPDSGFAYQSPKLVIGHEYFILNPEDFEELDKVHFKDAEGQLGIQYDYLTMSDNSFRILLNNELLTDLDFSVKTLHRLAVTTPGLALGQEYILLQDRHGQLHDAMDITPAQPMGRFSESLVFINNKLILNNVPFITHKSQADEAKTAAPGEIRAFTTSADRVGTYKKFKCFDSYSNTWTDLGAEGTALDKMTDSYANRPYAVQLKLETKKDDRKDIYAYKYASAIGTPLHIVSVAVPTGTTQKTFETDIKFTPNIGSLSVWVNGIRQYNVEEHTDGAGFDLPQAVEGRVVYIIETPLDGHARVCEREILTERNIIENAVNTYKTTKPLYPGRVSIYIDGLKMPKSAFTIIDNYTLVIQTDEVMVGNKGTMPKRQVLVNGKKYNVNSGIPNQILVEVSENLHRNEATFELEYDESTYIHLDKYSLVEDIMNTEDEILIFVDGMFTGLDSETGYMILDTERTLQINNILDEESNAYISTLGTDPLYTYLQTHPSAKLQYRNSHGGKDYVPAKKEIILEWS